MEPLLSMFEERPEHVDEGEGLVPLEEATTLDKIYKSTLLQPDIVLHAGTKLTKVYAETVDDN